MSAKVLLHVGTPKTGTSFLQEVLFRSQKKLAEHGIIYPAERFDAHFLAALDLMKMPWGGLQSEAVGAWDRLAEQVRAHDGTAIISHEILATASRSQVARAMESLGHPETEVHVILSVRDLVRQIPAEWQENVKHRSGVSYARFLKRIMNPARTSRVGSWFWGVQEIPDIANRWGHDLPPERIHLVTVPPPGGAPDLLWTRFVEAFGLEGIDLDLEADRANPSLGVPETALVRRINRSANRALPPEHYRPLVRELLAHQTLSQRTDTPRLALPPDVRPWVREVETSYVTEINQRGYHVIGDVDDLIGGATEPADPSAEAADASAVTTWDDPDRPKQREVADAAVDAIRALLLENARMREVEAHLAHELHETRAALDRSYLRPTYRLREKIVNRLQDGRTGRGALRVYRALRGRNSRST